MKYWIAPSNDHIFRIGDAIIAQQGTADWRTDKFSVGDIVFIYKTKPEQSIRYKMEVVGAGIKFEDSLAQEDYWTDKEIYYSGITSVYARLQLIEEYPVELLSLTKLHEHGLRGNIQSVQSCPVEVLGFILNPYDIEQTDPEEYDVDYPADEKDLYEGALVQVNANRYERNRYARKKCIELKGSKCLVCGKDFEETYGEIGKGFIHVHHIVPISSIGKEYKLDPVKDLVPVCPNCHYMLHRKPDGVYTIEELKAIIKKKK